MLQADQKQAFPVCGQHDYCQYCRVPCYAGEPLEKHADGTFVLREIKGDACLTAQISMELCRQMEACLTAQISMELCRQMEQGLDPLDGKSIQECLDALPVEEVPVFRKKMA